MKRTAEMTLGIIGAVFSLFGVFLGILFFAMRNAFTTDKQLQEELASEAAMNSTDVAAIMDILAGSGTAIIVASVLGIALGLIGVFAIAKNRKPVLAGWMFIAGSVLTGVISLGTAFLPAILYLVAGIMSLVRKAPKPLHTTGNFD